MKETKYVTVDIKITVEASDFNRETAYCKWSVAKTAGHTEVMNNNEAIYRAICKVQGIDADKYLKQSVIC